MPTFPKKKKRPWIPTRTRDNKGNKPTSYTATEYISFYNSKQWRSLRNYFIQMYPLCKLCEESGYVVAADCVDHIEPIRFGGSRTALNNLQSLCNSCHASKTGRESRIKKKNYDGT